MLLRIRSPDGTFRIEVSPTDTGEVFTSKILETIPDAASLIPESVTLSNKPVGGEIVGLEMLKGRKVGDMGFR